MVSLVSGAAALTIKIRVNSARTRCSGHDGVLFRSDSSSPGRGRHVVDISCLVTTIIPSCTFLPSFPSGFIYTCINTLFSFSFSSYFHLLLPFSLLLSLFPFSFLPCLRLPTHSHSILPPPDSTLSVRLLSLIIQKVLHVLTMNYVNVLWENISFFFFDNDFFKPLFNFCIALFLLHCSSSSLSFSSLSFLILCTLTLPSKCSVHNFVHFLPSTKIY